jgi:uncharacterized protein YdeI (YjbR/CyaY-like superfamily)
MVPFGKRGESRMETMEDKDDLKTLAFPSPQAWEDWLEEEHERSPGLWLKLAKKGSGIPSLSYEEALQVALCFGWIDGRKESLDGTFWLQRFTPRRKGSRWSKLNRERAERLIDLGRVRPAGLREIEGARSDGRWEAAYESQSRSTVPEDLQRALDASPGAAAAFAALNSVNRYAILYRVQDTKRSETRARKIAEFVERLAGGWKPYP